MTECRWCGNKFQPCKNSQKYCDECRSDPEVERARERKRKQLEREKKVNKRNDRQKKEKRCLYCNKKLDPSSNRQVWCEKCRINGYRDTRAVEKNRRKYDRPFPWEQAGQMEQKACLVCKKPFTPAGNRQKYCTGCGEAVRKEQRKQAVYRQRKKEREGA